MPHNHYPLKRGREGEELRERAFRPTRKQRSQGLMMPVPVEVVRNKMVGHLCSTVLLPSASSPHGPWSVSGNSGVRGHLPQVSTWMMELQSVGYALNATLLSKHREEGMMPPATQINHSRCRRPDMTCPAWFSCSS